MLSVEIARRSKRQNKKRTHENGQTKQSFDIDKRRILYFRRHYGRFHDCLTTMLSNHEINILSFSQLRRKTILQFL